jgi:hypothetical protein
VSNKLGSKWTEITEGVKWDFELSDFKNGYAFLVFLKQKNKIAADNLELLKFLLTGKRHDVLEIVIEWEKNHKKQNTNRKGTK